MYYIILYLILHVGLVLVFWFFTWKAYIQRSIEKIAPETSFYIYGGKASSAACFLYILL